MPILAGTKWGDERLGTEGGVVTWSVVPANVAGVATGFETDLSDITVDAEEVVSFDVVRALEESFAQWSEVADIEFVQVADDGARVTEGDSADIRVAFGEIDGDRDTLAFAFFPVREFDGDEFAGDILFDSDETFFFSFRDQFVNTAIHEIGHSIGLEHIDSSVVRAIMNPIGSDGTELFPDDIDGARQIYGRQDGERPTLDLDEDRADLTILGELDRLQVNANGLDNSIRGGDGDEQFRGRSGDDQLRGGRGEDTLVGNGGDDRLFGNGRSDTLKGGSGNDFLNGGAGADELNGGGRDDTVEGRGGRDSLKGGNGDDILRGGGRDDTLNGGAGDDTLEGDAGADVFLYRGADIGDDVIADFDVGVDLIDLDRVPGGFNVSFDGLDTLIETGSGTITVFNVDLASLADDVFIA